MEFKEVHNSLSGTPQGGIISPILANIYLHELDSYMESLKTQYEKGERRESNPEYDVLYRRRRKKIREGKTKEAEEILREMRKIPSLDLMDENFVRVKYVRYADDFLVMIIGNKKLAEEIREEVREFLRNSLKLELSMDKTKITNLGEERVKFLDYEITKTKENTKIVRNVNGVRKRAINGTIQLLVPIEVIKEHLKGFTKANKPIHHNARINDPILNTVNMYNAEIRGLYNYYCLATDVSRKIGKFKYYHYGSLLKTIARKEKRTVRQVIGRYGIEVKRKDGKGTRKIIGAKLID